jgi:glycosyltransferase involved in cell wall biosynthesis
MSATPLRACAVVPAFREEKRIGDVVRRIREYCPDVLVIDDGSGDGTAAAAEQAGAIVLRHAVNQGKGAALNTGFRHAREQKYEVVLTLDADGQHDPAEIPKFLEAYRRTGIPVLIGSRMAEVEGMPWVRRLTNRFMSGLLSRMMGQYVADTQCGYRLYRCDILPFVSAGSQRFAAESEILLRLAQRGVRMDSVRIRTIYGDEKSKIHPGADTVRFFSMLLRFRLEQRKRRVVAPPPRQA